MGGDRQTYNELNDSRQKSPGFEKKREGTVPLFLFSVYLALNSTTYRFLLCPPFFLDSIFGRSGAGWGLDSGWTQLAALTPPLPLGLADHVLHFLAGEDEKQPLGAALRAADKQVPPGIKAGGWRYLGWWLRRWRPGTEATEDTEATGAAGAGEGAAGSAGPGQMQWADDSEEYGHAAPAADSAGPKQIPPAAAALLRERRQLARQVLLSLEAKALPPGVSMEAEGYFRQLGPVRSLAGGPQMAGSLSSGDLADARKDVPEPAWPSNSPDAALICSSSVDLANAIDPAAELAAELLWLERLLAGRALLPKEVQVLLAENQEQLPAALRDSGYRFEKGDAGKASAGLGASDASDAGAGVWIPIRIQAAFQVLVLQGRALLRPAVGRDLRGQSLCFRCGQSEQLKPAVCGHCGRRACYYCESCSSLGLARECLPLYLVPGAKPASGKPDSADRESEREAAARYPTAKTGDPILANEAELDPGQVLQSQSVPAPVQLDFPLTPAQLRAAEEVRHFAAASPLKQCLVWALCGAGKTEVVFPALAEALARGGPVLYATPRRDVVQELAPRLKQAFPSHRVSQLYAGSGERFVLADIYAATTHQTLRFYQNFDLVILDEVDAYPYRDSPLLHYAVRRASRPGGKIIYLTATPSAAMQQQARGGRELAVVYIPARHHGFPVPEPELIGERQLRWPSEDPDLLRSQKTDRQRNQNLKPNQKLNPNLNLDPKQKLELPGSVVDLIQRAVAEPGQLLIFVPAVRLAGLVAEAVSRQVAFDQVKWTMVSSDSAELVELVESKRPVKLERRGQPVKQIKAVRQIEQPSIPWVQASHAGDPQREQKRQAFSQGDFPVLITTTILERGITIPRVNVLVLFADAEKIFDAGSLVQMAGRVGRTAAYPRGKVWLVGSRISPAMRSAQARIREMNRLARALGYLHKG